MSDLLALLVVGVAAAAAILLVARPLLRSTAERTDELTDEQRRRLALREERDAALLALRDLEFDHRTGKITDDDYRPMVRELRRRVAVALRALDPDAPAVSPEAAAAAGPGEVDGAGMLTDEVPPAEAAAPEQAPRA